MKSVVRDFKVFLFTTLLVLVSTNSYGALLSYSPDSLEITLAAGSQGTVPLTVSLQGAGRGSYYLWFINTVLDGNLPASWLSASPSTTFLSSRWVTAATTLTVNVPEGTAPGIYSGYLLSKAMAAHDIADPGRGALIRVTILSGCDQPPSFEITSFGPETLWPPNHKTQEVSVSGRVMLEEGCTLLEIGYNIDDEYELYTAVGQLIVASDGSFTVYIPVEAWRDGDDMDGRHYTITLFAQDEAGIGTSPPLDVLVPHDQGKK